MRSSVAGSMTSSVRPLRAARHSPLMKRPNELYMRHPFDGRSNGLLGVEPFHLRDPWTDVRAAIGPHAIRRRLGAISANRSPGCRERLRGCSLARDFGLIEAQNMKFGHNRLFLETKFRVVPMLQLTARYGSPWRLSNGNGYGFYSDKLALRPSTYCAFLGETMFLDFNALLWPHPKRLRTKKLLGARASVDPSPAGAT